MESAPCWRTLIHLIGSILIKHLAHKKMAFIKVKGRTKVEWLPVTTSTAFTKNTLVEWTSGLIAVADDNDTDIAGIIEKTIVSGDADYAVARKVPIIVPVEKHVVWEADTADTFVQATHGGVDVGIIDEANIDLDDTTNDIFRCLVPGRAALKVWGYLRFNLGYY